MTECKNLEHREQGAPAIRTSRTGTVLPFMAVLMLAGGVAAAGLQAQERVATDDATYDQDGGFEAFAGARMVLKDVASPGGSVQVTWHIPQPVPPLSLPMPWISAQFVVQMIEKYVPRATERDLLYFGRFMSGYGRGPGLSGFAFIEAGRGVIKRDAQPFVIDQTYGLWGIGLGLGYTLWRFSTTLEASVGGSGRLGSQNRNSYGVSLQYRVF
ncbi:MAG: hypothetical protein OXQ94_05535 [Gemmatimonadota bacterium]|nr:hypothetical protein [Gemmatimonadota bacterium]MDE2871138.1 hypothetical protein [Gemmatimonadota bacterium]